MLPKHCYYVFRFRRTIDALAAEHYCKIHQLPGRLIPLPRELSEGCGLALRVPEEDYLQTKAAWQPISQKAECVARLLL